VLYKIKILYLYMYGYGEGLRLIIRTWAQTHYCWYLPCPLCVFFTDNLWA